MRTLNIPAPWQADRKTQAPINHRADRTLTIGPWLILAVTLPSPSARLSPGSLSLGRPPLPLWVFPIFLSWLCHPSSVLPPCFSPLPFPSVPSLSPLLLLFLSAPCNPCYCFLCCSKVKWGLGHFQFVRSPLPETMKMSYQSEKYEVFQFILKILLLSIRSKKIIRLLYVKPHLEIL